MGMRLNLDEGVVESHRIEDFLKAIIMTTCLIMAFLIFNLAQLAFSSQEDIQKDWGFESFKVVLSPSPDERVVGHRLYFVNAETNEMFSRDLPGGVTESSFDLGYDLPESDLPPNSQWEFKATAYDADGNESVFSNSLMLNVGGRQLPEPVEPEKWKSVTPPHMILEIRMR